jgi:hypothetical protein
MIKRLIAILSILPLLVFLPLIPANSATKAGGKCIKVGSKSVVGNKTFTCVRSGKKLVWDKGSITGKKGNSSQTGQPVMIEKSWDKNYKNVFSKLNETKGDGFKIEPVYSSTVNLIKSQEILNNFTESIKFYTPFLGPFKSVTLVFMSEKDSEFYKEQVFKYEGPFGDASFMTGTHCYVSKNTYCAYGSNRISGKSVFYQFIGSDSIYWNSKSVKISNYHEAVHMYQNSLSSENMYTFMPPWFIEGQAVFFGYVSILNFGSPQDVSELKAQSKAGLLKSIPTISTLSPSQLVSLLNQFETDINYVTSKSLGYDLGYLICEYLYFNFDPEIINRLILNANSSKNWRLAVKDTLGVDTQELYEKVSKYILEQINS